MARVEAVIIAGGLGSRLLPLTRARPKHLLPVGGVPFVVHQLAKLADAGATRVVLATSYHADQFEPTLGDGSRWGLELVYVREAEPLGTAGAIRNAAAALTAGPDECVVAVNGDILSGHDLRAQVRHHVDVGADVTLHLVEVPDARPYGCVPTDDDGRVLAFHEKSDEPETQRINAGCYTFTRSVIDRIPADRVVSVERESFPQLLEQGALVRGWFDDAYWIDVGTPAALCKASADLVGGLVTSPAYPYAPGDAWIDPSAIIADTAIVTGGSAVGPRAIVGDDAVIDATVLYDRAVIGTGVRLDRCVVEAGAVIPEGTTHHDAVLTP